MICVKGQLVTLTMDALVLSRGKPGDTYQPAKVLSLTYLDQPEGQRGVQLDRDLAGSRWWMESDLEAAN